MSRERVALIFAAACAGGVAYLVIAAVGDRHSLVGTVGVAPTQFVAQLRPEDRACSSPVLWPAGATGLVLAPSTVGGKRLQLRVTLRGSQGKSTAQIDVPNRIGRWMGVSGSPIEQVQLRPLRRDEEASICIVNQGSAEVDLLGQAGLVPFTSIRVGRGQSNRAAMAMYFTGRERSLLASRAAVFQRASLFKTQLFRPWMFWLLLLGVMGGVGLVGWAMVRATVPDS